MKEISEARAIAESSNAVKILKGLLISATITLVLLFIFAVLLTYTNLSENTIGPVIIAISGISILARKLHDNMLYQKKWNTKWRNNRFYLYTLHLFSVKCNSEVALA